VPDLVDVPIERYGHQEVISGIWALREPPSAWLSPTDGWL
jgi:hypothetical protein